MKIKTLWLLAISFWLCCISRANAIQTFVDSSSQNLATASLSYSTTFPSNQAGYLSTVSLNFSAAPASAETIKVFLKSRVGANYDTELARYTTVAGTTTNVTFIFQSAIPITAGDQVKTTCTNVSAGPPTVYLSVVVDTAVRSGTPGVSIFSNGALVVASTQHRLLGNQHTDTTSAAVSRGDLITGQGATATWTRQAVGAANKFVNTDGTDVTWSSWTLPAPTGDDYVDVADSTTASTWRQLPNCTDVGGNHLNYTQATNLFSCGTTDLNVGDITTVGNCTTGNCATNGNTDIFPLNYEGTVDAFDTTFSVTDPTANRAIVFPNLGGTVALQTGAAFTSGSIPYIDANGNLAQVNANLFFDSTNLRIGVGDGGSSPRTGLSALSNNYVNSLISSELSITSATSKSGLIGSKSNGSIAAKTVVSNGDAVVEVRGQGYDGAGYINIASMEYQVDAVPGVNDMPGRIVFYTTPDGSTVLTERMRIDNAGNVGINDPSPASLLTVGANDAFQVNNTGGISGSGALSITPASGSNLSVSLATTGDFIVNTNQLVVDTSAANVGIGTAAPNASLDVTETSAGALTTPLFLTNSSNTTSTEVALRFAPTTSPTIRYSSISGIQTGSNNIDLIFTLGFGATITEGVRFQSASGLTRVGIDTSTINTDSRLEVKGHITDEGTAPSLSACGTTPSIVGNDVAGKVTIGTGVTTSCTLTFALAYTNAALCVVSKETDTNTTLSATGGTTTLVIASSADMASDVINYICLGRG